MRWQGSLLRAKPIPAVLDGVWEDAAPFDMLLRRGDKVQGLARASDSRTGREVVGVRASGAERRSRFVHETPVGSLGSAGASRCLLLYPGTLFLYRAKCLVSVGMLEQRSLALAYSRIEAWQRPPDRRHTRMAMIINEPTRAHRTRSGCSPISVRVQIFMEHKPRVGSREMARVPHLKRLCSGARPLPPALWATTRISDRRFPW